MLHFYTNPMSRGQIARWMLEEVGEPYEEHLLEYGSAAAGGMRSPAFLAINPMGKVPAIVHETGGMSRTVTEAAAICLYMADAFPDAGLAPPLSERAAYYRWVLFAAGPLEQAVVTRAMKWDEGLDPRKRATTGFGSLEAVADTLDAHLSENDFVCGADFTAADVYVGSAADWGLSFGTIPVRASFEAYAARLREREAYVRAKKRDNALIEATRSEAANA